MKKIIFLFLFVWAMVAVDDANAQRAVAPGKWIPTAAISYDYCNGWSSAYLQDVAKFDLITGASLGVICPQTGLKDVDSWRLYHPSVKSILYLAGLNNYESGKKPAIRLGEGSRHGLDWLLKNHGIAASDRWFSVGNVFKDYLEQGTSDGGPGRYSMVVGNSNWTTFCANEAFTWSGNNPYTGDPVTAVGVDGVFLDNSDVYRTNYNSYQSFQWGHHDDKAYRDYEAGYYSGSPGTFNTNKYRTDYLAGINNIGSIFSKSGKILVPNIDPIASPSYIANSWRLIDQLSYPPYAAMHEYGQRFDIVPNWTTLPTLLSSLQHTRAYISFQARFSSGANQMAAMNTPDSISGHSTGWHVLWYYMMSFMLGLDDRRVSGFLGFTVQSPSHSPYKEPVWFPEYDPANLHLGAALGNYVFNSGGGYYTREFQDGWVVVNPTQSTLNNLSVPTGQARVVDHYNLGTANSTALVSTYSIGPLTGIILLKPGHSITNSDNR
jgi:hypothetical protein